MAALTHETQHVILIGDHQQLRPTTSAYHSAKVNQMDVSLFERMIINEMPNVQLTVQHRMRSEISKLLCPHIYERLFDHPSVQRYPNVIGMEKNLFWLTHSEPEKADIDALSKTNWFEVQYTVQLCHYLMLQGYQSNDIVILTTYNAQLMLFLQVKIILLYIIAVYSDETNANIVEFKQIFVLIQERKKYSLLSKVHAAVVDNYQGEESRIILLSLVRSHICSEDTADVSIGYLSRKNRICVALSRAREGLYIIGNMHTLASKSRIWTDIECELERQQAIGTELVVHCVQHQNQTRVTFLLNFYFY